MYTQHGCVLLFVPFVQEAFIFPWATEGATRPKGPDADLVPFSPPWLQSILYSETDPEVKATAKAALRRGEALAGVMSSFFLFRSSVKRREAAGGSSEIGARVRKYSRGGLYRHQTEW